jgi:hypothetical protein
MNSAGIIYFKDTNTTAANYLMSFVASRVFVQWVDGPTELFFDFVGKQVVFVTIVIRLKVHIFNAGANNTPYLMSVVESTKTPVVTNVTLFAVFSSAFVGNG